MCTELQSLSSPYSRKNNAKMWHFKNASNSGILTELSSFLLSPKAVCAVQFNAFHCPAIKMWCVEGGGWAYITVPPAPTSSLVRTFLSWLQSSGFLPWCSWVTEKHSFMWWGHEIYNLGNRGHKKLLKSLIKACKESRHWDCGSWVRSEF